MHSCAILRSCVIAKNSIMRSLRNDAPIHDVISDCVLVRSPQRAAWPVIYMYMYMYMRLNLHCLVVYFSILHVLGVNAVLVSACLMFAIFLPKIGTIIR